MTALCRNSHDFNKLPQESPGFSHEVTDSKEDEAPVVAALAFSLEGAGTELVALRL